MVLPPSASGLKSNDCRKKAPIFQPSKPRTANRFAGARKISMSRNGPHTSTKKLSLWKSSTKIVFQFCNSKREKKSLSSSDFVTAAGMVQQSANLNRSPIARQRTFAGELMLRPGCCNEAGLPLCLGSFILLIRPTAIIAPTN
jgi:hypothetical protein